MSTSVSTFFTHTTRSPSPGSTFVEIFEIFSNSWNAEVELSCCDIGKSKRSINVAYIQRNRIFRLAPPSVWSSWIRDEWCDNEKKRRYKHTHTYILHTSFLYVVTSRTDERFRRTERGVDVIALSTTFWGVSFVRTLAEWLTITYRDSDRDILDNIFETTLPPKTLSRCCLVSPTTRFCDSIIDAVSLELFFFAWEGIR